VLVGTSLIVIIPEGIETLYSASGCSHSHAERWLPRRGAIIQASHDSAGWTREAVPVDVGLPADPGVGFVTGPDDGFSSGEKGVESNAPSQDSTTGEGGPAGNAPTKPHVHSGGEEEEEEESSHDPHAWVGISLITGFILMYLIDALPQHATTPSQPQRFSISLNSLSFNRRPSVSSTISGPPPSGHIASPTSAHFPSDTHQHNTSRPSSTTVGLVIHAAADGIALGASSTTTSRLSFIIFIALMIHKAPAAFGLTSVLLKQGLSKRMARAHLVVFSLAAPIGALLTWTAAHLLGYTNMGNSTSTEFATGVLLLFSAGTFLYVAMHTMQENGSGGHEHDAGVNGNGYAGLPMTEMYDGGQAAGPAKRKGPELVDTLVTVGGMLLPLLTQWGHAH
jgi:solute carrier family 39 (zinc transporter), member 9